MAKKIRMTRKKLREDEVRSYWFQLLEWLQENSKTLIIGVGIAAVIVILGVFIKQRRGGREVAVNRLITSSYIDIQRALAAENNQEREGYFAQGEEKLRQILDLYGRSKMAPQASFLLGNIAFFRGEYRIAEEYYKDYIDSVKDNLDKADGYIALGYTYENRFFWTTRQEAADRVWLQNALDSYLEAENLTTGTAQRYLAMLGRARLYDLQENQIERAKELYRQIAEERKLDEVTLSDQAKRGRYRFVLEQIERLKRLFTLAETASLRLDQLEAGD